MLAKGALACLFKDNPSFLLQPVRVRLRFSVFDKKGQASQIDFFGWKDLQTYERHPSAAATQEIVAFTNSLAVNDQNAISIGLLGLCSKR